MTIDPRVGMWISIIAAVLMFLAGAGAELTTMFSTAVANEIVAVAVFLGGLISAVNAVLHMIPSSNAPGDASKFALGPKGP
jgi:hypothetical protein